MVFKNLQKVTEISALQAAVMVCWAYERWHDAWLSVELLLLTQLPIQNCLSTPAVCDRECASLVCWYMGVCVRAICFKALQNFDFKVKQMDKPRRRYQGFSQAFGYPRCVWEIHVHVSSSGNLSYSVGLFPAAISWVAADASRFFF